MLAQQCHLLSTLEVAGCSQFTDTGFQALARNCRLLEKMDLEECVLITDATLIHLAIGCPRLEILILSHCELITDEGIRQLAMSPCAAENLVRLELDNCPLVTDSSLEHLVTCHNLQRVDLYDCQLITRAGIRRLRVSINLIYISPPVIDITPYLLEPLTKYQRTCLFRTSDTTPINWRFTSTVLSMLYNPMNNNPHDLYSLHISK